MKNLVERSREAGFMSRDRLVGVNEDYYYLWMCELQKWLREMRTPIVVTPVTDFVAWQVEVMHPDRGLLTIDKNEDGYWFNSSEEALEYGLDRALQYLEEKAE